MLSRFYFVSSRVASGRARRGSRALRSGLVGWAHGRARRALLRRHQREERRHLLEQLGDRHLDRLKLARKLRPIRQPLVALGRERCAVEVLTDRHDKVRLLLLRSEHFAAPYKGRGGGDAWHALVPAVLLARGALELMRELRMTPAAVITNDWVAALTAPSATDGASSRSPAN